MAVNLIGSKAAERVVDRLAADLEAAGPEVSPLAATADRAHRVDIHPWQERFHAHSRLQVAAHGLRPGDGSCCAAQAWLSCASSRDATPNAPRRMLPAAAATLALPTTGAIAMRSPWASSRVTPASAARLRLMT